MPSSGIVSSIQNAARRQKTPLWLVGGPVRDALLGRFCDDWDMVCRKARSVARETAQNLQAKFITLDEQNRIYRVILPEVYLPIRTLDFAELSGKTIEQDLARRDFTINAMALPLTPGFARPSPRGDLQLPQFPVALRSRGWKREGRVRGIIDPFGGQRDLKSRKVRLVSPRALVEDPLRLVRAFRFAAQFELTLVPLTLRLIHKHRNGLSKVAAERVREELLRLWKQPRSSPALRLMDRTGLLSQIFPEIEACRRTAVRYYGAGGVLKHSFETVENLEWLLGHSCPGLPSAPVKSYLNEMIGAYPRTAWLKLAAFLHDVGKPATAKVIKGRLRFFEHEHVGASLAMRVGQRLRCSRQEVQLLGLWVRNHMRPGNLAAAARITDKALSRFFRDMGENGVGMVLVSLADHYTYLSKSLWGKGKDPVEKICRKLVASYYEERSKILPARVVDGHELMKKFKLKPGPLIGQILEKIQDAQVGGKVTTRTDAIEFVKEWLSRRHPGRS